MDWNYYNDNDPDVVEWLRELIKCGQIPSGVVDDRSILDVHADDLRGFTQCHFFAGIGGWSLALQLAGWPPDKPVWTGSPPCQPFSVAGKDKRQKDDRHLAPKFVELVGFARPGMLFGEQVASAAVFGKASKPSKRSVATAPDWTWLDDLSDRLEASHYAVGAGDIPSAGVGAPHRRQRTFYGAYDLRPATIGMVNSISTGLEGYGRHGNVRNQSGRIDTESNRSTAPSSMSCRLAERAGVGWYGRWSGEKSNELRTEQRPDGFCHACRLADDKNHNGRLSNRWKRQENSEPFRCGETDRPSAIDNPWRDADWLLCRDGKWRPVEPGTFPLAHGVSGRVGLLRGYGNAINPYAAAEFIKVFEKAAINA